MVKLHRPLAGVNMSAATRVKDCPSHIVLTARFKAGGGGGSSSGASSFCCTWPSAGAGLCVLFRQHTDHTALHRPRGTAQTCPHLSYRLRATGGAGASTDGAASANRGDTAMPSESSRLPAGCVSTGAAIASRAGELTWAAASTLLLAGLSATCERLKCTSAPSRRASVP